MIEVHKLLTGMEQVDYKQFFTLADTPYDLRGHERSRLDSKKVFFSQLDYAFTGTCLFNATANSESFARRRHQYVQFVSF